MDGFQCRVFEGLVEYRGVLSRGLIGLDLCFGKNVFVLVCNWRKVEKKKMGNEVFQEVVVRDDDVLFERRDSEESVV